MMLDIAVDVSETGTVTSVCRGRDQTEAIIKDWDLPSEMWSESQ